MEIWKPVVGYEGHYDISSKGRLRTYKRRTKRLESPIVMSTKPNGKPYITVNLCKNSVKKTFLLHRLVATAFLGNEQGLPEVNHKDKDTYNNCVDNLEWVTKQRNVEHSCSKLYKVVNPDGKVFDVYNMNKFCKDMSLCATAMIAVAKGRAKSYKGWKVYEHN